MSAAAVVPPVEAPPAPPERPSFLAVAWATFLGYLVTAVLALAIGMVGLLAGGPLWKDAQAPGRGLFYAYDVWSWAAEACAGLLILSVTAVIVGSSLRERTGWEVGFGTIFLTLFATGYAPALAITPLYGATGLVSLLLAALVLRRLARPSGAEPRTALQQVPARWRRPIAIGVAIAVPVMALYTVGYAVTHPLRDWDTGARTVLKRDPGAVNRVELQIHQTGRSAVTDPELVRVEGSPALQVERARMAISTDDDFRRSVLVLRQGESCPPGLATLDAVWVRYTVLGMGHEQRIPLQRGPAVRCR